MSERALSTGAGIAGLLIVLVVAVWWPSRVPDFWSSRDQQGDRLARLGRYSEAARVYEDPLRQGFALYRAGEFKAAAAAFAHVATPEALFNQANALLMLGKYDDAIKAYDRALTLRPGWSDAEENRAIAVIRRDRIHRSGGDQTGGKSRPDEIVFDKGARSAEETVEVTEGKPLSDAELQALWLKRVTTRPADFLRARFAYQAAEPASESVP